MTTYATDETYDAAAEYWDDYDAASWYCNHDVPEGCYECARVRREDAMLEAMTPDERRDYFDSFVPYDEPF